jgi:hypothetical protein
MAVFSNRMASAPMVAGEFFADDIFARAAMDDEATMRQSSGRRQGDLPEYVF